MKRTLLAAALFTASTLCSAQIEKENWVEIKSPHFTVSTNAGDKQGREAALRFEQMRKLFGSLVLKDGLRENKPLTILAFKNSGGIKQVAPLWKGKPIQVAGLFGQGEGRDFIALDLSSENAWEVVLHEYAHSLLAANFQKVPLWFNEGFAEYFSTIKVTKKEVLIGDAPENYGAHLGRYGLMPTEKFFAINEKSPEYNESNDKRQTFYSQSWLVVHYLYDNKLLTPAAKYFRLTEDQAKPKAESFQEAFGMSFKEFDSRLSGYLSGNRITVRRWVPPEGTEPESFEYHKLKDYEALSLIAEMHLNSENYVEKAEQEFATVLEKKPEYEPAHRGLGYAAWRRNNMDEAATHFRKAADLGSGDPRVYYVLAVSEYNHLGGSPNSEDLIAISGYLDKAMFYDKGFADAYALKSEVLARARNLTEAITLQKEAVRLKPGDERYQLNLAMKYMYNGDLDQATALYEQLAKSSDASIASQAKSQLAQAQEWKAKPILRMNADAGPYNARSKAEKEQEKISKELEELGKAQSGEADEDDLDNREVKYVKGTIVSVDCSVDPGAVVTLNVAGKKMQLRAKSRSKVALIGIESFNCGWKNVKIAANYKVPKPGGLGDIVSLELQ